MPAHRRLVATTRQAAIGVLLVGTIGMLSAWLMNWRPPRDVVQAGEVVGSTFWFMLLPVFLVSFAGAVWGAMRRNAGEIFLRAVFLGLLVAAAVALIAIAPSGEFLQYGGMEALLWGLSPGLGLVGFALARIAARGLRSDWQASIALPSAALFSALPERLGIPPYFGLGPICLATAVAGLVLAGYLLVRSPVGGDRNRAI